MRRSYLILPVLGIALIVCSSRASPYLTQFFRQRATSAVGFSLVAGVAKTIANPVAPAHLASDSAGNIYFADINFVAIRKVATDGKATTIAGGYIGYADGVGTSASFSIPRGVATDNSGNLYVADTNNYRIRKISASGVVSTFAGSGTSALTDGTGTASSFRTPSGLAIDPSGNVYVADAASIRKITPAAVVTTPAGGSGFAGSADGTGNAAYFSSTQALCVDTSGNVLIADAGNHRIRKMTPAGAVTTIAGSSPGFADGTGSAASFNGPTGIAVDGAGTMYVADTMNNRVRVVTPAGVVTTLAGNGTQASLDGTGTGASFSRPYGITIGPSGDVFVADSYAGLIRRVTTTGIVSTYAGYIAETAVDGPGPSARFNYPLGSTIDASGNLFVADQLNHRIRKISSAGVVSTFAGSSTQGASNGTGVAASFRFPGSVAADTSGNLYIADKNNHLVRMITPGGVVTTLAGSGSIGSANGTGTGASFNYPQGIAVDAASNVYVGDTSNNMIRKITPAGLVTTLAGATTAGSANGTGTSASFNGPMGLVVDALGNVYVADTQNNLIRKITSAGAVTTLAGSTKGSVDGTGTAAAFNRPFDLDLDSSGNLFVVDTWNHMIRKVTPAGVVTTVAGVRSSMSTLLGVPLPASIFFPTGITVSGSKILVSTLHAIVSLKI